jgi:hypothetical protein
MKTIYRCRECGEDYKVESPTAKISNIGTVDELIYHLDPCTCLDDKEGYALDKAHYAEQENAKLRAQLEELQKGPDMEAVGLGVELGYKALWRRNQKLEAQLSNTRLGLEKLDSLLKKNGQYRTFKYSGDSGIEIYVGKHIIEAPTLEGLIDQVVLMEVE